MNTLSAFLVRVACLALAAAWVAPCIAQGKGGGLASDFDKLSPKERSKIAAKETQEAAADSGYQNLMQQADVAFRAGQYENALAAFQDARALRPYNVYPKVKIQDLQALIKRRDKQRAGQRTEPPPTTASAPSDVANTPPPTLPEPLEDTAVAPAATPEPPPAATQVEPPSHTGLEQPQPPVIPPAEQTGSPAPTGGKIPVPVTTTAPPTVPPAVDRVRDSSLPAEGTKPSTLGERIYMEAGATVTERTVEDDGRPVVYKKVVHPWGQTFHFKDGQAISDREWKDRFSE